MAEKFFFPSLSPEQGGRRSYLPLAQALLAHCRSVFSEHPAISRRLDQIARELPSAQDLRSFLEIVQQVINSVGRGHGEEVEDWVKREGFLRETLDELAQTLGRVTAGEKTSGMKLSNLSALLRSTHSGNFSQMRDEIMVALEQIAADRLRRQELINILAERIERSNYDYLTGLTRREVWEERVREEIYRARRYGTTFSLALFEIDDLARIERRYGRQVGDMVLQAVADTIKESTRDLDTAGRSSTQEIVLLMPQTSLRGALLAADKISREVKAIRIDAGGTQVQTSISGGVVEYGDDQEIAELIGRAGELLAQAKSQGPGHILPTLEEVPEQPPARAADAGLTQARITELYRHASQGGATAAAPDPNRAGGNEPPEET